MWKKTKQTIGLLAILSLMFLIACANNSSDGGDGGGEGNDDQVTLEIISVSQTEQPDGENELKLAEEFMEKHPNIKIEFIGVPMNDLFTKLTTLATGEDLPDVFSMTPEFTDTAVDMGMVADLEEVFGEEYLDGFIPNIREDASVDGKMAMIPWNSSPVSLVYRGDWFDEEGLDVPETWDDLIEAAQKLTKDTDGDGNIDQWGIGLVGTNNSSGASRFITILRTFGAEEIRQDESGNWVTDLDTPEAQQAFQLYGDLVNKYEVVPPGVTETGFPEAASMMANDQIAMLITGPNALGAVYSDNPDLKGKLRSAPLPKGENGDHVATFGLFGYTINAESEHKEEAAEYIKFLLEKENALSWSETSGRLPTRTEIQDDPFFQSGEMAGFSEAIQYAFSQPNFPSYNNIHAIVGEAYQNIIANEADVENETKIAADKVEKLIEESQ